MKMLILDNFLFQAAHPSLMRCLNFGARNNQFNKLSGGIF